MPTPGRVEVIYFPKGPARPRARTGGAPDPDPSATRTIEFRPSFADEPAPAEVAPTARSERAPAKRRDRKPARKDAGAARSPSRRRQSVEVDTDPALRYHLQKLDELLRAPEPSQPLRSLTRAELAEMSLFGHHLFEAGRLDEARVVFEGLVGLGVRDAFPHTMLGTVYLALDRQDRAMALFEEALALDPEDMAARVYRAELWINRGQRAAAVAELKAVVARGPQADPFVERARRLLEIVAGQARRRR